MQANSYLAKTKSVILEMIAQNEIDYEYAIVAQSDANTPISISSIDTVKIIIKLEAVFDIIIDDEFLAKLTCIEDFAQAVAMSTQVENEKNQEVDEIIAKVWNE